MLSIMHFLALIIMIPEIETNRLRFRQFTYKDLDDVYQIWTDPQVRKYLQDDEIISKEKAEHTLNYCIDFFQQHGFGIWALLHKEQDDLIGFCGFRFLDDTTEIEILYGIIPSYWGMGLATEAVKAAIEYGFEKHHFEKIVGANTENIALWRVMELAGMKYEKRTVESDRDVVYYTILRDAWLQSTLHVINAHL